MNIKIVTQYSCGSTTDVELPDGITLDDIEDHGVKWGIFFYKVSGEEIYREIELNEMCSEEIDYKRPDDYSVRELTEE